MVAQREVVTPSVAWPIVRTVWGLCAQFLQNLQNGSYRGHYPFIAQGGTFKQMRAAEFVP